MQSIGLRKIQLAAALWVCLPVGAVLGQQTSPAQATQKQAEPVSPPEAYRLELDKMLLYDVNVTVRTPEERRTVTVRGSRRDLCVFDIDADGNLVAYLGTKKPQVRTEPGERAARPAEQAPQAQAEPAKTEMIWVRRPLGKSHQVNPDGTVTYQPKRDKPAPYPVVPLPPPGSKPKEPFDLILSDLVVAEGAPMHLVCRWRSRKDGVVIVNGSLKKMPMQMGDITVQMASFTYEVKQNAGGIDKLQEIRQSVQSEDESAPAQPASERREGRARRRAAKPQTSALVAIRMAGTKPITESQRKQLIATINKNINQTSQQNQTPQQVAPRQQQPNDRQYFPRGTGRLQEGLERRDSTQYD